MVITTEFKNIRKRQTYKGVQNALGNRLGVLTLIGLFIGAVECGKLLEEGEDKTQTVLKGMYIVMLSSSVSLIIAMVIRLLWKT